MASRDKHDPCVRAAVAQKGGDTQVLPSANRRSLYGEGCIINRNACIEL